MAEWPLEPKWAGKDVFVYGGGPSALRFNTDLLAGSMVIGCNDAYKLGSVVSLLHFGDVKWYRVHEKALLKFRNPIIHSCEELKDVKRLHYVPRLPGGWYKKALGWNGNTGASAINLALIMGAARVFLIGFDMKLVGGRSNWHENLLDNPTEEHYARYMSAFALCSSDLENRWSGVKVINLNPDSALSHFPKMTWEQAFEENPK